MMEQGGRPCHIDLPYPQVTPGRDPLAVCLLMEDYSGAASELSAVHQYIYAAAQLKGKCDPVSQLLRQVAIVEMHHLELLAQAVLAKGGDPRYAMRGGRKPERFWNAGVIAYGKGAGNILLESIQGEQGAIAQYQQHIQQLGDESAKALLRRIVMDEECHLQAFTDQFRQWAEKEGR